jgi:FtsZ-interacting cell division protein ZipA
VSENLLVLIRQDLGPQLAWFSLVIWKEVNMSPIGIVLVAIVIIALIVAVWLIMKTRRTRELQSRFGPEYQRTVRSEGDARAAEKVLHQREERVARLNIVPLDEEQRSRFAVKWENEQAHFVDEPRRAVEAADRLVADVMRARGYPVSDFEQRVADVSVDHPVVVENYRAAHNIAIRDSHEPVSTEELRNAMIHYRALFADLLHDGGKYPVRDVRNDNSRLVRGAGR